MISQYDIKRPLGEKTAAALGLFDGLHLGHKQVIDLTAGHTDLKRAVFSFGMQSARPDAKKNANLLMTDDFKSYMLSSMGIDYFVCPAFESIQDMSPQEFVQNIIVDCLKAQLVCAGSDFRFGRGAAGDVQLLEKLCKDVGVRVVVSELIEDNGEVISSTGIRKLISKGKILDASRLLGHPFSFEFKVLHGRQLGRTLGFPTINQKYDTSLVKPKFGVYASKCNVDGRMFNSVTNIGVRPTVGSEFITVETHIIGYNGDLYDRSIAVSLYDFIRDEKKFESVQALKSQVLSDIQTAENCLQLKL